MKVTQLEKNSTSVGARVNTYFIQILKESGLNTSQVIESSIGYFLTLPDQEKIRLLQNNDPKSLALEKIIFPQYLQERNAHSTVESLLYILYTASDEELATLTKYMHLPDYKEKGPEFSPEPHSFLYEILHAIHQLGPMFFQKKQTYSELVFSLAENMSILNDASGGPALDRVELAIGHALIRRNQASISSEEAATLTSILELLPTATAGLSGFLNLNLLEAPLSLEFAHAFSAWTTNWFIRRLDSQEEHPNDTLLGFLKKKVLNPNIIYPLEKQVIYPILCLAALRYKHRYNERAKCQHCGALLMPNAKFCMNCGTKIE